jgi:hypothetical protein
VALAYRYDGKQKLLSFGLLSSIVGWQMRDAKREAAKKQPGERH